MSALSHEGLVSVTDLHHTLKFLISSGDSHLRLLGDTGFWAIFLLKKAETMSRFILPQICFSFQRLHPWSPIKTHPVLQPTT